MNNTNPSVLFGMGKWEQIVDRFLYCADSSGATGGSKKIMIDNLPPHKHGIYNQYDDFNFNIGENHSKLTLSNGNMSIPNDVGTDSANETRTTYSDNTGSGSDYMPPYMTVFAWKRVA